MKNITELRVELTKIFAGLKDGSVTPDAATEMNNAAGKIINTCKVQLEYASLRKKAPAVAFLDGE